MSVCVEPVAGPERGPRYGLSSDSQPIESQKFQNTECLICKSISVNLDYARKTGCTHASSAPSVRCISKPIRKHDATPIL